MHQTDGGEWLDQEAGQVSRERAALRRVAQLMARDAPPQQVLDELVVEGARLLGDLPLHVLRYGEKDGEPIATAIAVSGGNVKLGLQWPAGGETNTGRVLRTGRPARTDSFEDTSLADTAERLGVAAGVMVPILVAGRVWGALSTSSHLGPMPAGTEDRLAEVGELLSAAITGFEARRELQSLAEEQAAVRRVAELVAHGADESRLFDAVVAEASKLVADEAATLLRFDADRVATVIATRDGPAPVGAQFTVALEDDSTPARVLRTGRAARLDAYADQDLPQYARRFNVRSSVGAPVLVDGGVWGMIGVTTISGRLPAAAEARLQQFADLVAAALANVQARARLQALADEQAALRRVAELVARGDAPERVFDGVTREASALIDAAVTLTRFEGQTAVHVVARCDGPAAPGTVIVFGPDTLPDRVLQTRTVTRVDDYSVEADAELAAEYALVAAVSAAVEVEGAVWGMLTATSHEAPLPPDTEHRLHEFAQLVGFAIGNAETRDKLTASRARVVASADEARRRLQRDVHDGAQQRLVQTVVTLKLAGQALTPGDSHLSELLAESLHHAERATADLRDLVRGIMPAALVRGGLAAGVASLAGDLPVPFTVDIDVPRLAQQTETTAYFIVAEALTNVVKHARATRATVEGRVADGHLVLAVCDDGVGGALPTGGSGLTGLLDRVEAAEGSMTIDSPAGAGTTLRVSLPLGSER